MKWFDWMGEGGHDDDEEAKLLLKKTELKTRVQKLIPYL